MMADVQVFHNACGFKGEAVNKYGQLTSAPFSPLCHLYGGKIMLLKMSRQCRSCFQIPLKWQTVNEKKKDES